MDLNCVGALWDWCHNLSVANHIKECIMLKKKKEDIKIIVYVNSVRKDWDVIKHIYIGKNIYE